MSSVGADKKDLKEPLSEVPERPEETQEQPGRKGPQEEAAQALMDKVKSEGVVEGESASNLAKKTSQGTSETPEEPKISSERAEMEGLSKNENSAGGDISNLASETLQAKSQEATQMHVSTAGNEGSVEEASLELGMEDIEKCKGSARREDTENHPELSGEGTIKLKSKEEMADQMSFKESGVADSGQRLIPRTEQQKRKQVDSGTIYGKSAKKSESDTAGKTDAEEEATAEDDERTERQQKDTDIGDNVVDIEDSSFGKADCESGEEKETSSSKQGEVKTGQEQAARYVKMAVVLKGYPEVKMTEKNAELLESVLAKKIVQTPLAITVQFITTQYEDGAVIFTCANKETKFWLVKTVPGLTLWDGAELEVFSAKRLKPGKELVFWITRRMIKRGHQEILNLLEKQNKDISTKQWEILKRTTENKAAKMTVWMDENSFDTIKTRLFKLYLGLGQVTFRKEKGVDKRTVSNQPQQRLYQFKGPNPPQHLGPRFRAPNAPQLREPRFRAPNRLQSREARFVAPNAVHPRERRFVAASKMQHHKPRFVAPNPPHQQEFVFMARTASRSREPTYMSQNQPQLHERRFMGQNQGEESTFMTAIQLQPQEPRFVTSDQPHYQNSRFIAPEQHESRLIAANEPQHPGGRFLGPDEVTEPRFMGSNQLQPQETRYMVADESQHQDSILVSGGQRFREPRFVNSDESQFLDSVLIGGDTAQSHEPRFVAADTVQPRDSRSRVSDTSSLFERRARVASPRQSLETRYTGVDLQPLREWRSLSGPSQSHSSRYLESGPSQTRSSRFMESARAQSRSSRFMESNRTSLGRHSRR